MTKPAVRCVLCKERVRLKHRHLWDEKLKGFRCSPCFNKMLDRE